MAGYLSLAAASCYDSHLSILRWGIDCPLSVQKKHGAQVPSHQLGSLQTWILISGPNLSLPPIFPFLFKLLVS